MHRGRAVRVVALVVLVAAVAGVVGLAGHAGAQSGGPRSDGATPIDSCRTIASDGRYVLTGDVRNDNRTVCIQILSGDVAFDGAGHTIEGANATESVGVKVNNSLTGLSNVTVENVSTTGWTAGVYYRGVTNGSLRNVNASANARHGVLLRAAPNTGLENVTAVGDGRWSLYAVGNSSDVVGTDVDVGSATVSFTASDAALTGVSSLPGTVPNRTSIGQRVGAAGTGKNATLRLGVAYDDANATTRNVTENTLRMWVYDRNWTQVPGVNFVNIDGNHVVADLPRLRNASTFAPAGETPTPTATATATPTATTTPTPTGAVTPTSAPTTTSSGDGRGFGVPLAVLAVLAAAFALVRR